LEVVELASSFCQQHLDHCPTVQLSTHNTYTQIMRISTHNFKQFIHAFFACTGHFIIFLKKNYTKPNMGNIIVSVCSFH
jgi:hypothetical protein